MFIFWWKEDEIKSHFRHMSQSRLQIDTIHSGQFWLKKIVIFFFNFALLHNLLLSLRQQQSL